MTDERWIVIPKWAEFQHYKDRSPSWIKNYTRLLSDDAYLELTYAQRGLLHGIWLLRASMNEAPTNTRTRHLLTTNKGEARHFQDNLDALSQAGFIEIRASKPLADSYKNASPEKEKEKKELRAHARKDENPRCPISLCGLPCTSERRLLEHLENVHSLEGQNALDAIEAGRT